MNYGVPYMGSKNRVIPWLLETLPTGFETFVDLFAGGCAVTHALMLRGDFRRFVLNDLDGDGVRLFVDGIRGKYRNETRWISREDFFRLRDTDPYVNICWSFGSKGGTYLYGAPIEPYKKAMHGLIVFDDPRAFRRLCPEVAEAAEEHLKGFADTKTRRIELGRAVVRRLKEIGDPVLVETHPLYRACHFKRLPGGSLRNTRPVQNENLNRLERLERLERLQNLESLQSLESLERLQRLERLQCTPPLSVFTKDYAEVPIPPGALVYCDPPYNGKTKYRVRGEVQTFDSERFYDWCCRQTELTVISEYDMPPERFVCVASKQACAVLAASGNVYTTEKLFVPRHQLNLWNAHALLPKE